MLEGRPAGSLGPEVRRVALTASATLGELPYALRGGSLTRALAQGSIVVLAPFFFAEALPFDGALGAARTLSVANAFGAAHFLAQDRMLDGDEESSPEACHFSDVGLSRFVREHARLFEAGHPFWSLLDAYLDEYFRSLAWERRVLRTQLGRGAVEAQALDAALRELGRRLSPLKASAAGIALLSRRQESLGLMEQVLEDYHTAFQLTDDIADLHEDVAHGRWSVVAWMTAAREGIDLSAGTADNARIPALAVTSGAIDEIVHIVSDRYSRARDGAIRLGARSMADHVSRLADETVAALRWQARRASKALRAAQPSSGTPGGRVRSAPARLHAFRVHGDGFVVDPGTCLFFRADGVALDVLEEIERGASESDLDVLSMNHGRAAVQEVIGEAAAIARVETAAPGDTEAAALARDGAAAPARGAGADAGSGPPSPGAIATVALHVSGRCNLSCDYCYLGAREQGGAMSDDVALRAIELLLDESLGAPHLAVVFFGGEPLLELDVIERVADRARELAEAEGRTVSFHVTTNGTLLTAEAATRLAAISVGVLVSIDGDRAGHDAHRHYADGSGSYRTIASNLAALPPGLRVGARATVTTESPPLPDLVRHLGSLGFSTVHLAPVSGIPMPHAFASRLCAEFEELGRGELDRILSGRAPRVGNFLESVLALECGHQRRVPCGAGARYVSVSADGTIHLCHRFAGDPSCMVGDVVAGFDRDAARLALGRFASRMEACGGCWARWLCGGPCYHDLAVSTGDAVGETAPRCRVRRRVLEVSMWMYAALPDLAREKLSQAAGTAVRPEVAGGVGACSRPATRQSPCGPKGGEEAEPLQACEQAGRAHVPERR